LKLEDRGKAVAFICVGVACGLISIWTGRLGWVIPNVLFWFATALFIALGWVYILLDL